MGDLDIGHGHRIRLFTSGEIPFSGAYERFKVMTAVLISECAPIVARGLGDFTIEAFIRLGDMMNLIAVTTPDELFANHSVVLPPRLEYCDSAATEISWSRWCLLRLRC